ncbi:MAG: hypothetical protein PHO66_03565 [Eubacteriales bacterium]|nr:hypothetical protein [Eubacteriales bacterium]
MKRSLMQVYVKGADKAISLYQQAFDAAVLCRYADDDGVILHCELDLYG